jgi:phosphate:Na+ symporter
MTDNLYLEVALNVVGGLGIFLVGMKYMSEGIQATAGGGLRKAINFVLGAPVVGTIVGVLVGLGITCIVQSSSVTTVMVVGLVNSGVMALKHAIGVIFGANIGTTITGWILVLEIGKAGLPILGFASFFFLFSKKDKLRYIGMAIMGIGMVFFGLELMKDGFKPLRHEASFEAWFHAFQATTYLGVLKCALVGCILTMIVQSSSATLGITMGLASTGIINLQTAGALVLGENIGTTVTAYLASLGANTAAKRAAYAHVFFNVLGVAWITLIYLPLYLPFIQNTVMHADPNLMVLNEAGEETFPNIMKGITLIHTGFNVTNTLIFIPFAGLLARFVTWLVPEKEQDKVHHLTYLDVRMIESPILGIQQSLAEIVMMKDHVNVMSTILRKQVENGNTDEPERRKLFHREEILDDVQREVTVYLSHLLSGNVTHRIMDAARQQLRIADEMESVGDYYAMAMKRLIKMEQENIQLDGDAHTTLLQLHDRVSEYTNMIADAVHDGFGDILTKAVSEGSEISHMVKHMRDAHLARMSTIEGGVSPMKSLVYTDVLQAYRKIKDHMLNVAEALAGEK